MSGVSTPARVWTDHREGRAVVIKRAADVNAEPVLRAEAQLLDRMAHPGLIRPLSLERADRHLQLVTAYAGSHTLETAPPTLPTRAARQFAQVATTVAHLHASGLAHGNLCGDHVVISGQGEARVCGLSTAAAMSCQPDDAQRPSSGIEADLIALRKMGLAQLSRSRLVGSGPARKLEAERRTRLRRLLDDPTLDAATLAARAAHIARPTSRPSRPHEGVPTAEAGSGRRASRRLLLGSLGAAGVVSAASGLWQLTAESAPSTLIDCAGQRADSCGALGAGETLPEPWHSYELRATGDGPAPSEFAIADWNCDGTETLGVAGADRTVHVFETWPHDEEGAEPVSWRLEPDESLELPDDEACSAISTVHDPA